MIGKGKTCIVSILVELVVGTATGLFLVRPEGSHCTHPCRVGLA